MIIISLFAIYIILIVPIVQSIFQISFLREADKVHIDDSFKTQGPN